MPTAARGSAASTARRANRSMPATCCWYWIPEETAMTLPASAEPRRNLTEHIYQRLKQDIFDFRLLPGDRITENVIAEQMSASRTPVREALMRLQREGFVDRKSTRLNSSHVRISYAVFCLKKKKKH